MSTILLCEPGFNKINHGYQFIQIIHQMAQSCRILALFWQMTKGLILYFVSMRCGVFGKKYSTM